MFRMNRSLLPSILFMVEAHYLYPEKENSNHWFFFPSEENWNHAMRMLNCGVTADSMGNYVRKDDSTVIQILNFFKKVIAIFTNVYLRSVNNNDIARLLLLGKSHVVS